MIITFSVMICLVMMDDALSIYRHFISLDATQPLGVDENMRREVESNICTENGIIDPDCFEVAQKFAFNTLQNRSVLKMNFVVRFCKHEWQKQRDAPYH